MTTIYKRLTNNTIDSGGKCQIRQMCPLLLAKTQSARASDNESVASSRHKRTKTTASAIQGAVVVAVFLLCSSSFPILVFGQGTTGQNTTAQNTAGNTQSTPLDLSALDGASQPQSPATKNQGNQENKPANQAASPTDATGSPPVSGTENATASDGADSSAKATGSSGKSASPDTTTVWELVMAGGWIGVVIFILSLYACMRVVQFCLAFRRSEMMPQDTCREVSQLVESGRLRQAIQCCDDDGSAYARIVSAALSQTDGGWSAVEQTAQDALAEEAAGMYRHVEVLSVVGNIAPMLGLLGTVLGMVIAFGELATSDGLAKNLAQGIYFALVTTVDGLLVAIPSLLAFSFFNNRVAVLTAELTHRVESTLRPLRRGTQPPGTRGVTPGVKVSGLQELK